MTDEFFEDQSDSRLRTSYAMSAAIFEDYCRVVATLENKDPKEIAERLTSRAKEVFEEMKNKDLDQMKDSLDS